MSPPRSMAVVALLFAACGAVDAPSSDTATTPSSSGAAPSPRAAPATPAAPDARARSCPRSQRVRDTADESEGGRIEGTVLGPDGKPRAGVEMTLWLLRDLSDDDPGRVFSDSQGRFVFDGVPFDTDAPWVQAAAAGLAPGGTHASPTRDAPWARCELQLQEYAWVDLVVTSPDGVPAAACVVAVNGFCRETVALDADGRGVLAVDMDGPVTLTGIIAPYPAARATVDVARGERRLARMTIDRGVAVDGRVIDDRGEPIAGAEIHAHDIDWICLEAVGATSDDDGVFRLARLASLPHDVSFRADDHDPVDLRGVTPAEDAPIRVVLRRHGAVTLRLSVLDGVPTPPSVELCGERLDGDGVMNETIEWPGTAAPVALPAGRWHFVVSAKGFARCDVEVVVAPGTTADPGRIELDAGIDFVGVVVDATGRPVGNADVHTGWERRTTTDAAGRFVFEHSPRRPMEVCVYADGFVSRAVTADPTSGRVAISLVHGALVRGTSTYADGGTPGWPAKARLRRRDRAGWDVDADLDRDGSFKVRVTPGPWTVEILHGDRVLATRDVDLGEGDDARVSLVVATDPDRKEKER